MLFGREPNKSVSERAWEKEFPGVIELVNKQLPGIASRLEAIDIQNCLCEFFKYEKTLWGMGSPKQRYDGI